MLQDSPKGNPSTVTYIRGALVQQPSSHDAWYGAKGQPLGQSPVVLSTMSGRLGSREVDVSSPDVEGDWTF